MANLPGTIFICIALLLPPPQKNPRILPTLPSLPSGKGGGADRRSRSANTGCQLQRDDHHTHTLASHMFGSAHSHTHSAARSLSNFLTFARTLICTPVQSLGPDPLLWLRASGAHTLFSHLFLQLLLPLPFPFSHPRADHIH